MIINAGIVRVVFEGDYPDPFAMELFEEAGMELVRMRNGIAEVIHPGRARRDRPCE
jgi:dCMP deaminase